MEMPEEFVVKFRVEYFEYEEVIKTGDLVTWDGVAWRVTRVLNDDPEAAACLRSMGDVARVEKVKLVDLCRPAACVGDRARSVLTGHHGTVESASGKWAQFLEDGEERETRTKMSNLFPVAKALR